MSTLKILIVEDEILIAETIKLYLEEKGHIIQDICISYREATRAIEREQPDLVVLDIRLYGEKSGIDVAKYIKQQSKKIASVAPPHAKITHKPYRNKYLDTYITHAQTNHTN